jgi:hypothetical protein
MKIIFTLIAPWTGNEFEDWSSDEEMTINEPDNKENEPNNEIVDRTNQDHDLAQLKGTPNFAEKYESEVKDNDVIWVDDDHDIIMTQTSPELPKIVGEDCKNKQNYGKYNSA